jgi:glycosyltransferase involved in cell wall biosynthesis
LQRKYLIADIGSMKKVLVVSYTFPPYPGIGGRRWAKFAKQLAQKYEVHVICAENPFKEISQWSKDVQLTNIKIHPLPIKYPKVLLEGAKSFSDKLIYRFWMLFLALYSKGVTIERTIFWRKQFLNKAKKIIKKEGIENVVISIPPFRLAYYAATLKKEFPNLNLVLDYRDPWTDNRSYHGFSALRPSRLKEEERMERAALKAANYVFTVSDIMTSRLKERSPFPERVSTLNNGFDPDDIGKSEPIAEKGRYTFIYAGTLYSNLDYIIEPLLQYMQKLKNISPEKYNKLYFEFYGNHNKELEQRIIGFNDAHISVYKPVTLQEIHKKLACASFGILMSAPDHSFAFNTKFFEYLANRKPILLFSNPGETSGFVEQNQLGFFVDPKHLERDMDKLISNTDTVIAEFNRNFDISNYTISSLTSQLEKAFK